MWEEPIAIVGGAFGGCERSLFLLVIMGGAYGSFGRSLYLLVVVGGASGRLWEEPPIVVSLFNLSAPVE